MLEFKHNEAERIQRDHLLMELLNVNSLEEIYNCLSGDMENFVTFLDNNNGATKTLYDSYNSIFSGFLDEYRDNVLYLAELQKQTISIMSATPYLNANNALYKTPTIGNIDMSKLDLNKNYLQEALDAAMAGDLDTALEKLLFRAKKIDITGENYGTSAMEAYNQVMRAFNSRGLIGYNGFLTFGQYGKTGNVGNINLTLANTDNSNSNNLSNLTTALTQSSSGSNNSSKSTTSTSSKTTATSSPSINKTNTKVTTTTIIESNTSETKTKKKKNTSGINEYASGIENGPVTETGLALLHGSEANPEYVLNNDLAYQLLKNLTTQDNYRPDLNNPTSSMEDDYVAGIGLTTLAEDELEALNKIITQLSAAITSENVNGSKLQAILSIIDNLYETQQTIQKIVNDDYDLDGRNFLEWLDTFDNFENNLIDLLTKQFETLKDYLDNLGNLLQNGIGSIDSLIDNLGSLSTDIKDLGANITEGITSIPSFDDIYGQDFGISGIGSVSEELPYRALGIDYWAEAVNEAKKGNADLAWKYYKYRGWKLSSKTDELGLTYYGIGNNMSQKELEEELYKIFNNKGYAEGIENGPVTTTGLTMLHGSDSNPEYVLNNNLAYQLLKNLSTLDNYRPDLNNATASMDDAYTAGIGVTTLANEDLEALNKLIQQMSGLITEQGISNSQLLSILTIIGNLYETLQIIEKVVNDDYQQDGKNFLEWLDTFDNFENNLKDLLANYFDTLKGYLDNFENLLNQGINSIGGLVDNLGSLSTDIKNLGANITEGITSISSFDDIYNDKVNEIEDVINDYNNVSSTLLPYRALGIDYWAEAEAAAKRGEANAAWTYYKYRGWKLSGKEDELGQKYYGIGNNMSLSQLELKLYEIFGTKGYAEGIENGPVSSTGLSMLHGSDSNPEYVLNNSQAYQLLKNFATQEVELNNATASLDDAYTAGIGLTTLAEDEVEGINDIIKQLSGIMTALGVTNAQIQTILTILGTLNETSLLIRTILTDEGAKFDSRFITLFDDLDKIQELIDKDITNDNTLFNSILSAVEGLSSGIKGMLTELSSNLNGAFNSLGNVISGLGSSGSSGGSGDFDENYGDDFGSGNGNGYEDNWSTSDTPTPGIYERPLREYSVKEDWTTHARKAAEVGDAVAAYAYYRYRGLKLSDPNYHGTGGSVMSQDQLRTELNNTLSKYGLHMTGYANGIENGPVTETGVAMLHGTSSNPEYVLNNDQAYLLLKNLATTDLNNETASSSDAYVAGIGITGVAKTELEGINKMIVQISGLITELATSNVQLQSILTLLSGLQGASLLIQNLLNDEFIKDDSRFIELFDILDAIQVTVEKDLANDLTFFEAIKTLTTTLAGKLDEVSNNVIANSNREKYLGTGYIDENGNLVNGPVNYTGENNNGVIPTKDNINGGYNNGNSGGSSFVGDNGAPSHYYGPSGVMTYYLTAGGTYAVDEKGNKYDVSDLGEYIKRGMGSSTTTERRLDLAGTTLTVNGKSITYDKDGYVATVVGQTGSTNSLNNYMGSDGKGNAPTPNPSSNTSNKTTAVNGQTTGTKVGFDWNGNRTDDPDKIAFYDYERTPSKSNSSGSSSGSGSSGSGSSGGSSGSSNKTVSSITAYKDGSKTIKYSDGTTSSTPATKKYATGLDNGPVTYTGLAMLHGSPSKPEYVVNNDLAYNMLRNLASLNMPEFESTIDNTGETIQYILQGDINLETENPAQFWQEVTNAMGRRFNVTKNNKR